jgi:hypothetical protein
MATSCGLNIAGIAPAMQVCTKCPWRIENQRNPLEDNPHFYTAETRAGMWFDWGPEHQGLADGTQMVCHVGAYDDEAPRTVDELGRPGQRLKTESEKLRWCAGGDALQQRALLRWVANGNHAKPPLRGPQAGRWVVSAMLDVPPWEITCSDWTIPDTAPWWIKGRQVTFRELVAAAHPAVFDPNIGSEQVPPLSDEERAGYEPLRAESEAA